MAALPLSPPVFSILSGLIEARAGLHYSPSDQELLAQKVSERALEAGFDRCSTTTTSSATTPPAPRRWTRSSTR